MSDQQRVAVAGLLACGVGALAVGKRKADRQDDESDAVEVPIHG